jgi:NADH-quinone oxidoreductase subunit N
LAGAVSLPGADLLTLAGLALVIAGIGFKLALAPFHLWTPDVYEGAPAPVTAFIATVSKGAIFALLLRLFATGIQQESPLFLIFVVLAVASMFIGNLLGLLQQNLKRVLAYSSIANMGYLLVAFLAGGQGGAAAATFYLVAYIATLMGAFAIITALSGSDRDADEIDDYLGLAWRRPWLAGAFTVMLLSLIGIPLTAGFVGKFYLLLAGIAAALSTNPLMWVLAVSLVINSVIGLFYYLRIVITLYRRAPAAEEPTALTRPMPVMATVVLTLATTVVLWLGLFPSNTIALIDGLVGLLYR